MVEEEAKAIKPVPENYGNFINITQRVSRKTIPRGCSENYIPGLNPQMKDLLQEYYQCFSADPFADSTTEKGEELMTMLADERSERWINLVEELDHARDSSKAWKFVKRINGEKSSSPLISKVTPKRLPASQLKIKKRQSKSGNVK